MRGSTDWQVTEVFKCINDLGSSKHEAKIEARAAGASTFEQVGQVIGLYGTETYKDYVTIAKDAFNYIRAEYGCNDLQKVESHMIHDYLLDKIQNGGRSGEGVERATYDKYSSGLHKLELALNKHAESKGQDKSYNFELKAVSKYAAATLGDRCKDSRAYQNVDKLVAAINSPKYNLTATLIRETGFRISEISTIKPDQIKGFRPDPYTKEMLCWIGVNGKGGKYYERGITPATSARLDKAMAAGGGEWNVNQGNFREALKTAAAVTKQAYESCHGIRWNVAQEWHSRLQEMGYSYETSLSIISKEVLCHNRSDITKHYLI